VAKEDLLYLVPKKRVKAFDGMAVTADVWELSHEYARQQHRFHLMLTLPPGILLGLNVIASIPPDTSVYILPGVAVDNWGQTVVLPQPMTYKIGNTAEGLIYLLLHYEQSQPRAEQGRGQEGAPMFVYDEFSISVVSKLPDVPFIELARIDRSNRTAAVSNAVSPEHPDKDEIDLRYRNIITPPNRKIARVMTSYVGGMSYQKHGDGIHHLVHSLNRDGHYKVVVDVDRSLDSAGLEQYDLLYLVAENRFDLSRSELNNLYTFIQNGGTLLFETCQRTQFTTHPPALQSFTDILNSFGFQVDDLRTDTPLLKQPNLFAMPPRGFEPQGTLQIGEGIILSTYDYGGVWQGKRRDGAPTRQEIRTVFEWGENILQSALQRKEDVKQPNKRSVTSLTSQLEAIMTQPD